MAIRDRVRSALSVLTKERTPGAVIHNTMAESMPGVVVTDDSAMRFATVHACVRVLSEDIASLPLHVYQRDKEGGKERLRTHPLYELIHDRPNPEMTAFTFKECMMVNVLLTGNAYAFIEFNQAGQVIALWPLLSDSVVPYRSESGQIRYRAGQADLSSYEVLHIPGMSFDGLLGLSPIAYARESIGLGMAAEQFGSKFFKNGTHLGGVITDPGVMGDAQFERAREQFGAMYKGLQNSHGIPILEKGATYTPIGIPPEDAQFLETRKFQRTEIAAIYRMPLHLIGDLERATFSNIEHQDLGYLQRTLLPWLVRWEQGMATKLLTTLERKRLVIEFDTANFLRGDTKSRMEAYSIAVNAGIMTPNEARAKENMNPMEGGDEIRLPLNTQPGSQAGALPAAKGARSLPFPSGGEQRAADEKEKTAAARWELTDQGIALLEPIMLRLLESQRAAVLAAVDRVYGLRSAAEVLALRELLKDIFMDSYGKPSKALSDALTTIVVGARKSAYAEIGLADAVEDWYGPFVDDYTRMLAKRLNGQNYGELMRMLEKVEATGGNVPDAFYRKLKDWGSKKARRMAETEGTRMACSITSEILVRNGYEVVWVTNPSYCNHCQRLNGKSIAKGGLFADKATGFGGLKKHPPLHHGCKCTVRAGAHKTSPEQLQNKVKNAKLPDEAIAHSNTGDFTLPAPQDGYPNGRLGGGGHGQAAMDEMKRRGSLFNVLHTYPNGVRVGNVPQHKSRMKRSGREQSWFPES